MKRLLIAAVVVAAGAIAYSLQSSHSEVRGNRFVGHDQLKLRPRWQQGAENAKQRRETA